MKIAIITPFKDGVGGVEVMNYALETVFKANSHEVDYFTIEQSNIDKKSIVYKLFGYPFYTAKSFNESTQKYDIVICNGEFSFGIDHPKCINIFHGSYYGINKYLKKYSNIKDKIYNYRNVYIQKKGAKNKYVVSVSNFLKTILYESGIQTNKVIENCIDIDFFRPHSSSKDNHLFVGRYDYYGKGFDILEKLADMGVKIDCVTDKDPKGKLRWIKTTDRNELVKIYNAHKILIFPSRFEAFGLVPLEALACGIPIVMAKVGIGVDLQKHIPDFIIEDWGNQSAEEYFKRIQYIENNYQYFSDKARSFVEQNYSYTQFSRRWISVLEDVANAKMGNKE